MRPPSPRPVRHTHPHSPRGSILIVALLLSAIISVSLVSYLQLSNTTLKIASRSFLSNSSTYLSESGIELAMACLTDYQVNGVGLDIAWPTAIWTKDKAAHTAKATFPTASPYYFPLGANATGVIKVCVQNHDLAGDPVIVAKSVITPASGGGPVITKYLKITLARRSRFTNGLVAQDSITWVGRPEADSWNSAAASPAVAYSAPIRTANCTVGCVDGNISLGSGGQVYGYAKTGASGVTSGGSVHGLGTIIHDSNRVTQDFSANFPVIIRPVPFVSTTLSAVPIALPKTTAPADIAAADGRYYYSWPSTLGAINNDLRISGNITITMIGRPGADAIGLTGSKTLTIMTGASLILYTDGHISAFGNGIANSSTAEKFQIYGTATAAQFQRIVVGGNGNLIAAIYAPNAAVELKGGGSSGNVMGAVVAKTISMNGGTNFHYDEALASLTAGGGYRTSQWKELQSAAERAPYVTLLNF